MKTPGSLEDIDRDVQDLVQATEGLLALCERYLGPLLAGGEMTKARAAIAKVKPMVEGPQVKH